MKKLPFDITSAIRPPLTADTFVFFDILLATFGKPKGLKTCPSQFVITWYHSCFHNSSSSGKEETQTDRQTNRQTQRHGHGHSHKY